MEKLQKALSKARRMRGDGTIEPPPPRETAERGRSRAGAFPDVWNRLQTFDPDFELLQRNRVMTLRAQADANPFDILRTKIFLLMQENGWKRIAITSPGKGTGKTTTACNLVVGISRQPEIKSVLIDLDFRRPGVSNVLGHKPKHDVRDMLSGTVAPEDQMVRLRENVAISMAARPVEDPMQVLLSQSTMDTLQDIETRFAPEIMFFDLPPMLASDDARAMLKAADCALIVARAEQTKTTALDVCEREVAEHTNVLGVVLNSCRHLSQEEEYYNSEYK